MNRTTMRCIAIAAAALGCLPASAQPRGQPLYSPEAMVEGRSMAEWSAEWAQYILASAQTPAGTPLPLADTTGAACSLMQHGPVWFLVGTQGGAATRACTVPQGTALFVPLINLIDYNVTNQSAAELRAESVACMDQVSQLRLEIDGVPVPARTLGRLRAKSPAFAVVLPPAGDAIAASIFSPGVNDGYYAMLTPLAPGQHTLRFGGASAGCYYAPTNFQVLPWAVDVTYQVTVVPVNLK